MQAYWTARGIQPTAWLDTYGCQQNEADSERMLGSASSRWASHAQQEPEGADLIIINTCAVREHAEQRVFGNLGALTHTRRRHPEQLIFLTGCMAGQETVVQRIKKSYPHVAGVMSSHAPSGSCRRSFYKALTVGKRQFVTPGTGNIVEACR